MVGFQGTVFAACLAGVGAFAAAGCIAADQRAAGDGHGGGDTSASDGTSPGDTATSTSPGDGQSGDSGASDARVDAIDPSDGTTTGTTTSPPDATTTDVFTGDAVECDQGCGIGELCVFTGTSEPGNPCRVCDPQRDPHGWVNAGADVQCDDGDTCTDEDHCDNGKCAGVDNTCDDPYDCTQDSCNDAGGCDHDVKSGQCLIAGTCMTDGTLNPDDQCLRCDPRVPKQWTIASQASCDDDDDCTIEDTCSAGGTCGGRKFNRDTEPNNDAEHTQVVAAENVTEFPAGDFDADLNPLTDVDWFSWAQPINTPDGVYSPKASISNDTDQGLQLCVYAMCGQTSSVFAQPVVTCSEGTSARVVGKRAGCCVSVPANAGGALTVTPTCVGALVHGFGYASVELGANVDAGVGAQCGGYHLEWGAAH